MSKIVKPLTFNQIRSAKPKDKLYKLSDGWGLALWVLPSGVKSWRMSYTRKDGKRDTLTLGLYPDFSLHDAREWRAEIRAVLARGKNPKTVKNNAVEAQFCFEKRLIEWHTRWENQGGKEGCGKNKKYAKQVLNALQDNVFPDFLGRDVRTISTAEIVKCLRKMENRGVLEYLRRVKISLGLFFDYLVADGSVSFNPVRVIGNQVFQAARESHFSALSPDELPLLIERLETVENVSCRSKLLIYWQLLTMTRPIETAHARIDEIDLNRKLWEIPLSRMKTREHVVPLSPALLALYDEIMAINVRGVFLFEGRGFDKPISGETALLNLHKMQLNTTAHGLRALARTYLRERYKIPHDVGELLLSHAIGDKTERAYSRLELLEERRHFLTLWGNDVMALREQFKRKAHST